MIAEFTSKPNLLTLLLTLAILGGWFLNIVGLCRSFVWSPLRVKRERSLLRFD
jgi:hypothetical protein